MLVNNYDDPDDGAILDGRVRRYVILERTSLSTTCPRGGQPSRRCVNALMLTEYLIMNLLLVVRLYRVSVDDKKTDHVERNIKCSDVGDI